MPPDFSEIQDFMENYGRNSSSWWHQRVLVEFVVAAKTNQKPLKKELFFDCIKVRIQEKLEDHFPVNLPVAEGIYQEWVTAFDDMYSNRQKEFWFLAIKSVQFVRAKIHHAQMMAAPPTVRSG